MDTNSETFVKHVVIWEQEEMLVHSEKQAQVGALIFNKVPTIILAEYSDYSDIFSAEYMPELRKHTGINDYAI